MYWTAFKSEYILEHGVREHCRFFDFLKNSGLSELGVRGVPSYFGRSQQGGGARAGGINYAHYITPPPPPPQIFTLSNDPGTDQGSHRKGGKGIQGRSPPPTMWQKPLSSRTAINLFFPYSRVRNKRSPMIINFLTFSQGLRPYSGLHSIR